MESPQIAFECLPLRSVARFDVPFDAPPAFQALCQRVKAAAAHHGFHNSYYLHRGRCVYHLTNDPHIGVLTFQFEGVVLTDTADQKATGVHLDVQLTAETCDWLTAPVVRWFQETVQRAVSIEFDRFIAAGDLQRTRQRAAQIEAASDAQGGFIAMGL